MGDRSNIVIEQSNGERIYLYGHWMGADAINVVTQVLARRTRWADESYLTRMLFNKMTQGDADGETGYGISTYVVDNDGYPFIVLKPETMTVFLEKDNRWNKEPNVAITPEIGFEEFLNAVPEHANYDSLAVNMGAKLVA
jgi:hypothetical protein